MVRPRRGCAVDDEAERVQAAATGLGDGVAVAAGLGDAGAVDGAVVLGDCVAVAGTVGGAVGVDVGGTVAVAGCVGVAVGSAAVAEAGGAVKDPALQKEKSFAMYGPSYQLSVAKRKRTVRAPAGAGVQ